MTAKRLEVFASCKIVPDPNVQQIDFFLPPIFLLHFQAQHNILHDCGWNTNGRIKVQKSKFKGGKNCSYCNVKVGKKSYTTVLFHLSFVNQFSYSIQYTTCYIYIYYSSNVFNFSHKGLKEKLQASHKNRE